MKRIVIIALVGLLVASTGACGKRKDDKQKLLGYVHASARLAARYVYTDQRFDDQLTGAVGRTIEVQGLREDDFRFKARVLYDDAEGFDEVVSDDTLMVRFVDPNQLSALVNKDKLTSTDQKTDREGVGILAALRSRRWVADPSAAPSLTAGERKLAEIGKDPVLDALTALQYVESAINQSAGVNEYSADDVTPAYYSSEDDFPKPADGSSVKRFDLFRPSLPAAVNRSGRDEKSLPTTADFRRMAIYVQHGRIVRVLESVDLRGKRLDEFIKYNRAALKANDVPQSLRDQFEAGVKQRPKDPKAEAVYGRTLLSGLNLTLAGLGIDPVLIRTMSIDFRDLGGDVKVDLPQDDVITGNLDFLLMTDSGKAKSTQGGGDTAPGATTTTAPADASSSTTTGGDTTGASPPSSQP